MQTMHLKGNKIMTHVSSAKELVQSGDVAQGIEQLKADIRKDPSNPDLRLFLFQLFCIVGKWEKAMTQLNVTADLHKDSQLMVQVCRALLNCEMFREHVFRGKQTPLVFGEPEEWLGWIIQASRLFAEEKYADAAELLRQAFEKAPAAAGTVNGEPFEWIADADSRLGPVLEIIVNGRYYWTALNNIKRLKIEKPADLRDIVWLPATVTWQNGGQTVAFIPSRYASSESGTDGQILMARRTEWIEKADTIYFGLGQRMFVTDSDDYSLFEIDEIVL